MSDEVQQQDRSLPCPSGGFLKRLAQWNDRHSNACHGDAWCDLLEVVMHGEQEARHEGVPDPQDVARSVNSAIDDLVRRLRHGENYDGQEAADRIEQLERELTDARKAPERRAGERRCEDCPCLWGECENGRLQTPDEWQTELGHQIMDPDGWRAPHALGWDVPITRNEYERRRMMCTQMIASPKVVE